MSFRQLLLRLITILAVIKVALSIRNGDNVYSWRAHNKAVVFISRVYPQPVHYSTGNLVHRRLVLTSALAIPENFKHMSIRIGSLQSFHGGEVRAVQAVHYVGVTQSDLRMRFCLAYLDLPVGSDLESGAAYLAADYLRPLGYYKGNRETFVVSGWHRAGPCPLNHQLNSMLVKESNTFTCSQGYHNVEQYVDGKENNVMGCYCPIACPWICSTDQFPGTGDNGGGVYKINTKVLVGLAQGLVDRKKDKVNVIMSYSSPVQYHLTRYMEWLHRVGDDYKDYPEFNTKKGIF